MTLRKALAEFERSGCFRFNNAIECKWTNVYC